MPADDCVRRPYPVVAESPAVIETVEQFMARAVAAYYAENQPFGAQGDFTTAPEISQLFGDMLGLFVADLAARLGGGAFHLVELGPGRGTLMADILRILEKAGAQANVHLVEASHRLRDVQCGTIGREVTHHDSVDTLPDDAPVIIVANEFFDALPIRQLVRVNGVWHERGVQNKAAFCALNVVDCDLDADDGAIVERGDAARGVMEKLAALVAKTRGGILAVDYGYQGPAVGDTLQAVRAHQYVSVFEPAADITAHVDFTPLLHIARAQGMEAFVATQGRFLQDIGIRAWAEKLKAKATPEQAAAIDSGYTRLTDPAQMGELFKVLCAVCAV